MDTFPHTNNFVCAVLLLRADVNDLLNPGFLGPTGLEDGWGPEQKEVRAFAPLL